MKENEEKRIEQTAPSDPQAAQGIGYYISKFNPFTFHKRGEKTKAYIALGLVCFLWGTAWLASKEGVRHMPALQMAGIRQFLGGLCYIAFFTIKGARWPVGKEWKSVIVLSFLNFVLSNALSTWGVQYISAGLGAIIGAIFPLWLIIIAKTGSKTKMKPRTVLGLVLGFSGICVVFFEHLKDFLNPEFRFGIFISLISTWSWAFGTLYIKKHAAQFNPYFSLGLQMAIAGIVLFIITAVTGTSIAISSIPWQAWSAIGYLVLFSSVVAFMAYLYALQNLPTEQATLYAYVSPIIAIFLGSLLFDEKLTFIIILGIAITLSGVYLVNKAAVKIK